MIESPRFGAVASSLPGSYAAARTVGSFVCVSVRTNADVRSVPANLLSSPVMTSTFGASRGNVSKVDASPSMTSRNPAFSSAVSASMVGIGGVVVDVVWFAPALVVTVEDRCGTVVDVVVSGALASRCAKRSRAALRVVVASPVRFSADWSSCTCEALSSCQESSSESTAGTSAPASRSVGFGLFDHVAIDTALGHERDGEIVEAGVAAVGRGGVDVLLQLLVLLGEVAVLRLDPAVLVADAFDLAVETIDDSLVDDRGAHEDTIAL